MDFAELGKYITEETGVNSGDEELLENSDGSDDLDQYVDKLCEVEIDEEENEVFTINDTICHDGKTDFKKTGEAMIDSDNDHHSAFKQSAVNEYNSSQFSHNAKKFSLPNFNEKFISALNTFKKTKSIVNNKDNDDSSSDDNNNNNNNRGNNNIQVLSVSYINNVDDDKTLNKNVTRANSMLENILCTEPSTKVTVPSNNTCTSLGVNCNNNLKLQSTMQEKDIFEVSLSNSDNNSNYNNNAEKLLEISKLDNAERGHSNVTCANNAPELKRICRTNRMKQNRTTAFFSSAEKQLIRLKSEFIENCLRHTVKPNNVPSSCKRYRCLACKFEFISGNMLKSHLDRVHILFSYACPYCRLLYQFFNKCELMLHGQKHVGPIKTCHLNVISSASFVSHEYGVFTVVQRSGDIDCDRVNDNDDDDDNDDVEDNFEIISISNNNKFDGSSSSIKDASSLTSNNNGVISSRSFVFTKIDDRGQTRIIRGPVAVIDDSRYDLLEERSEGFGFFSSRIAKCFSGANAETVESTVNNSRTNNNNNNNNKIGRGETDKENTTSEIVVTESVTVHDGNENDDGSIDCVNNAPENDTETNDVTWHEEEERDDQNAEQQGRCSDGQVGKDDAPATTEVTAAVTSTSVLDMYDVANEEILGNDSVSEEEGNRVEIVDNNADSDSASVISIESLANEQQSSSLSAYCYECRLQVKNLVKHYRGNGHPKLSLKCEKCCFFNTTDCAYAAHLRIHRKEKPYICPDCAVTFDLYEDFYRHISRVCYYLHKTVRYICPMCGSSSGAIKMFVVHFMTKHVKVLFKCSLCVVSSHSLKIIEAHTVKSHRNTNPSYQTGYSCALCPDIFISKTTLNSHLTKHATDIRYLNYIYFCSRCKLFSTGAKETFVRHTMTCSAIKSKYSKDKYTKKYLIDSEMSSLFRELERDYRTRKRSNSGATTPDSSEEDADCVQIIEEEESDPLYVDDEDEQCVDVARSPSPDVVAGDDNGKVCVACRRRNFNVSSLFCSACVEPIDADRSSPIDAATREERQQQQQQTSCSRSKRSLVCSICKYTIKNRDWTALREHFEQSHEAHFRSSSGAKSFDGADGGHNDAHAFKKRKLRNNAGLSGEKIRKSQQQRTKNSPEDACDVAEAFVDLGAAGTLSCAKCPYKSRFPISFRSHILLHKNNNDDFQCPECGECFVVQPTLLKHLIVCHNIKNPNSYLKSLL